MIHTQGGSIIEAADGTTLAQWEHNGYHDSDFYAVYYDRETDSVRSVEHGTTRFAGGSKVTVDATDEVKALAAAALARAGIANWREADVSDALDFAVGKRVRVFKGRKVAVGTEGVIGWLGADRFSYERSYGKSTLRRIGLDTDDGERVWLAAGNCEVIDAAQYLASEDEVALKEQEFAEGLIARGNWAGAYRSLGHLGSLAHDHPFMAFSREKGDALAASVEAGRKRRMSTEKATDYLLGLADDRREFYGHEVKTTGREQAAADALDGAVPAEYLDERHARALIEEDWRARDAAEALAS